MSEPREPQLPGYFAESTPFEIRQQILDYHATECMSDVERARYFGLPEGCRMRERAKIISPKKLKIGINCWIGEGAVLAESSVVSLYQSGTPSTAMAAQAITSTGGSQPHTNLQPYLCVDFIISLFGIFPSQT